MYFYGTRRWAALYKILIVEDDLIIANIIKEHIEGWGYEVRCVTAFKNVLEEFAAFNPQLVLLDIGLPFFNGFHWCNEIRKLSKVPIVFISSAGDNMNIVLAMNAGADDFLVKPFDLTVLTAKVQAVLRRSYEFAGQTHLVEHRGAVLNMDEASLSNKGEKVELTRNEYKILQILMENKGKVVSRDTLMNCLWQTDSFIDENTLTVNMTRVRRKLEDIGLHDFIETKKGLGYQVK